VIKDIKTTERNTLFMSITIC